MADWSEYWRSMKNLQWSALDQHVLEVVGNAMGWGPDRSLLEIGAGRAAHSTALWRAGRCGDFDVVEPSPAAQTLMARIPPFSTCSPMCYNNADEIGVQYDIVWSYGLIEHFPDIEAQDIVDHHFRLAREQVVIVVPAATWTRRLSPPRADVPWQRNYTKRALRRKMAHPGWAITITSFAPLFGLRHIPDAFYPVVDSLTGWALPGNLLLGVAEKST